MDHTARQLYLVQADYEIHRRTGISFQDYFVEVASLRWETDFEARRPQGKLGDGKCDGYRVSNKCVFQAYATRAMQPSSLKKKISEDFEGAKQHFGNAMERWCLVHNDRDGLPSEAHDLLIQLRIKNPNKVLELVGPVHMLQLVSELTLEKLSVLFPSVPSSREIRRVQFKDIDELISAIAASNAEPSLDAPKIPSEQKLAFNKLSPHVMQCLKQGEVAAATFAKYFAGTTRADVGNRVSERFKRLYTGLKTNDEEPDAIFFSLVESVGGLGSTKERSAAILGLLSYLFHTCEIFEDTPQAASA